jgi:hypothetical protein
MKRRDALKHIGLTAGFVVATPTLVSLLQSCSNNTETWTPIFLTEEQGLILKNIVDVILPKTDTPSASEVNVPEFIDKYFDEILDIEDQDKTKAGFSALVTLLKTDYKNNLNKLSEDNYKYLLDNHMLLNQPQTSKSEPMTVSDVLHSIKWMSINAYKISETVGETILAYDPVPGIPKESCITVEEATGGVAWSLS